MFDFGVTLLYQVIKNCWYSSPFHVAINCSKSVTETWK